VGFVLAIGQSSKSITGEKPMKKPTIYNSTGPNTAHIPSNFEGINGILPTSVSSRIHKVDRRVRIPTHKGYQRGSLYARVNGNVPKRLKQMR
jgi:hypothetical protein